MFPVTFMNRFVANTLACIVLLMVAQTTAVDVTVTKFAGNGTQGDDNGKGTDARFHMPNGLAFGPDGNLYVTDGGNQAIRMITPDGMVSTYADCKSWTTNPPIQDTISPNSLAIDPTGSLYVSDSMSSIIWKVAAGGKSATLFAGNLSSGNANGQGSAAQFNSISGMAFDSKGNLYVADLFNYLIRMVNTTGYVSTFAGSGQNASTEGVGTGASFNFPVGIAVDSSDNVFVSETVSSNIRKIRSDGVATIYAGTGAVGEADGIGKKASFNVPHGLAIDPKSDIIYVAESIGNVIRMIEPNGNVTKIAGTGFPTSMNGDGLTASFNGPDGLAFGPDGALYVSETYGNMIRKISFATSTNTTLTNMPTSTPTNTVDSSASSGSHLSVGLIVGIVVGVVIIASVIGIGVFVHIRNRNAYRSYIPPPPPAPYEPDYIPDGKPVVLSF